MKWSIVLSVAAVLGLAFALGTGSSGAAEDAKKDGDCYKFVAPFADLMEVIDGLFTKMPEKAKQGKFKELKREALFVAEFANLMPHEKEHLGKKEWVALADQMKAAALKLAEAAEKKDETAFKSQHAAVEKSCDTCHEKFRDN